MRRTSTTISIALHALRALMLSAPLAPGAHAVEVEAGPIHTEIDARTRCPALCADTGGLKWDGKWRATSNNHAVCICLPPPNPAVPPLIRYDNTTFSGGDLPNGRAPATSFALCGDQCLADPRCVAYTWSADGMCQRKEGRITLTPGAATSGYLPDRGTTPPRALVPASPDK